MENNALARLRNDELCIVTLKNGHTMEVRWSAAAECFMRTDTEKPAAVAMELIGEWWPAGVRF